jgi:tryptophan-rich sensory protein
MRLRMVFPSRRMNTLNLMKMIQTLALSILIFYAILIVTNIPAPLLGLNFDNGESSRLWYAPPGYVIPIVWFILFTLLGIGRYKLLQDFSDYQWWLFGLAFLCAAYAYYTLGLSRLTDISALWFGLFGNLLVIVFAAIVVYKLYAVSRVAAFLTVPVILWTLFASIIVIGEMKLQKLI